MSSTHKLFRKAALNAAFQNEQSSPLRLPKVKQLWMSIFLMSLLLGAIVTLFFMPFHQTQEVKGWISANNLPTEIRNLETNGQVEEVFVRSGQYVKKGAPLFSIKRYQANIYGRDGKQISFNELAEKYQLESKLLRSNIESNKQQQRLLSHQMELLEDQLSSRQDLSKHAKSKLKLVKEKNKRLKVLVKQGNLPAGHLRSYALEELEHKLEIEKLALQEKQDLGKLETTKAKILKLEAQNRNIEQEETMLFAQLKRERAQLKRQFSYTITAPEAGQVDNLHIKPGTALLPQQTLAHIIPKDRGLNTTLIIPTHQAAFIKHAQKVSIKVEAFNYRQFGSISGIIEEVSRQVVMPSDRLLMPVKLQAPSFIVKVHLDKQSISARGRNWPLRNGMTLSATIRLTEQTVVEWLLAPLYEFKGTLL